MRVLIVFVGLVVLGGCRPASGEQGRPQTGAKVQPDGADKGQAPPAPEPRRAVPQGRQEPRWTVKAAVFSPDGKTVLVGYHFSKGYGVHAMRLEYWEVASGKLLWSRSAKEDLTPLRILPGGKQALVAGEASIQLWNVPEGRPIKTLFQDKRAIFHPTATPSGKVCLVYSSVGFDHQITAIEVPSGKVLGLVMLPAALSCPAALSPDGRSALCADQNGVELWNLPNHRLLQARHEAGTPVVFSPDGKLALCGVDQPPQKPGKTYKRQLVLWETQTGKDVKHLDAWGETITFLPDEKTLVIANRLDSNSTLMRIEWATGRVLWKTKLRHSPWVVAISPDGRWGFTSNGGGRQWRLNVSVWDLETGKHLRKLERSDDIDP